MSRLLQSQNKPPHRPSYWRVHRPIPSIQSSARRHHNGPSIQRFPISVDDRGPLYAVAPGDSSSRHNSRICRRRFRSRLVCIFRHPSCNYDRPRFAVPLQHLVPTYASLGRRTPYDYRLPSGGKWTCRALPPPSQGVSQSTLSRRTRSLVLAPSMRSPLNTDRTEARRRRITSRPRLRRRPRTPRRTPRKSSARRCLPPTATARVVGEPSPRS